MPNDADIARLPPKERDILKLHMVLRKSQTEVAKILRVSQPTVNYRYKRARERLEFMEKVPVVTADEIREVLRILGARDNDIEAMVLYVETSSQSEVARRMNTSQGAVRHWILRALVNHLQNDMREDDKHKRVRTACGMLVGKPGIFNEPAKHPGNGDSVPVVDQRLTAMPRVQGRLAVGERLLILDGLYAKLEGVLTERDEGHMTIRIDLESQKINVTWPC
jgi:DNA-directed RNA polymerase specialized sigma24 family protein